ncbi:MAG: hypothetical protein KAT14_00245 [Candidatus Marinimicrobia bacterium]|nr:hypothetical protein [Candidatus Neomarinimicrobiota bacterium]
MKKDELNELVKKSGSCCFYDRFGMVDDIDKAIGVSAPCDFGAGQIGGSFYIDFYGNADGNENFYKYIIPALNN